MDGIKVAVCVQAPTGTNWVRWQLPTRVSRLEALERKSETVTLKGLVYFEMSNVSKVDNDVV